MAEQKELATADEQATAAAENMLNKAAGAGDMPATAEGAQGGLSSKAPGKVLKAKNEMEEKKEGEEEDEEEYNEEEMKKKKMQAKKSEEPAQAEEKIKKAEGAETDEGTVAEDALIKALNELEAAANGTSTEQIDRRQQLAEGFANGTLSKAEQTEMLEVIGGQEPAKENVKKSENFQEQFANDEQLTKDYDVSGFIERQSQLMATALDALGNTVQKSRDDQSLFNKALAKSFKNIGEVVQSQQGLIKSQQESIEKLSDRLGTVENTPMTRKSKAGVVPIQKSFDGGNQEADLNQGQIMDGLFRLMQKSNPQQGFLAPCGEQIDRAVALYEQTGQISRSMINDVQNELGNSTGLR
jgi:hypothetical protein